MIGGGGGGGVNASNINFSDFSARRSSVCKIMKLFSVVASGSSFFSSSFTVTMVEISSSGMINSK